MRAAVVAAWLTLVGVTVEGVEAQTAASFLVESPSMTTGTMMPRDFTPDGRNLSPPLSWSGLPSGTEALVVICQDHGAGNPPPWVHWLIYNIPATAEGLPQGLPFDASDLMPPEVEGAVQGNNGWGLPMYRGPAPPGESVHHYHFAVYALDEDLGLPAGLTRDEVLEAIDGHVIGRGDMVPLYRRQPMGGGPG